MLSKYIHDPCGGVIIKHDIQDRAFSHPARSLAIGMAQSFRFKGIHN